MLVLDRSRGHGLFLARQTLTRRDIVRGYVIEVLRVNILVSSQHKLFVECLMKTVNFTYTSCHLGLCVHGYLYLTGCMTVSITTSFPVAAPQVDGAHWRGLPAADPPSALAPAHRGRDRDPAWPRPLNRRGRAGPPWPGPARGPRGQGTIWRHQPGVAPRRSGPSRHQDVGPLL